MNHFAIHLKLKQPCKSSILQYKIKIKLKKTTPKWAAAWRWGGWSQEPQKRWASTSWRQLQLFYRMLGVWRGWGSISCPTPSFYRKRKPVPREVNRFIQATQLRRDEIRPRLMESRSLFPEEDEFLPPTCRLLWPLSPFACCVGCTPTPYMSGVGKIRTQSWHSLLSSGAFLGASDNQGSAD